MEDRRQRIFKSTIVTPDTLAEIYRRGTSLEYLSLQKCGIRKLPDNLFLFLPNVKFVDLRNNYLISLPHSLAFHQNIECLLINNNLFKNIPPILASLPKLKETGLRGLQTRSKSSYLETTIDGEASGPIISLRPRRRTGVDSWGRKLDDDFTLKANKSMQLTTMFISKKQLRSQREIKCTIFQHWRSLARERKEAGKKEAFGTVAKKKIQTVEVFMNLVEKQREIDFDMISVYYRDLFVRAVEKVLVIVREAVMFYLINKIIQEYGDKNKIHQFEETEESALYRKFLNTWKDYWDPEKLRAEKNNKKKERRLWTLEKDNRINRIYFSKNYQYYQADDQNARERKKVEKERMKSISLQKWSFLNDIC